MGTREYEATHAWGTTSESIIGRGLVARALRLPVSRHRNVLAFAAGPGDSGCTDDVQFDRELELLETALRECRRKSLRLVYCSSAGAIYGDSCEARDEDSPLRPTTPYGRHKLACESLVRQTACRHLILRMPIVVGSRANSRQLIPSLVAQTLAGHIQVFRHAMRDLLGVDRLRLLVDELLGRVNDHETVVLASGVTVAVTTIVDMPLNSIPATVDVASLARKQSTRSTGCGMSVRDR